MKIKMTRKQLIELEIILKSTNFDHPITGTFRYMTTANVKALGKEIEEIREAFPPVPKYVEYIKKENEIYLSFGLKTKEKEEKDKLEDDKKLSLEEKLIAIKTEYASAITEQEVINKEYNTFLQEETEIELKTVKPHEVPVIGADNKVFHWAIWNLLNLVVAE